jgi:glutathione S-transferase-like protein
MAVKLHRCSGMWAKMQAHPCWRVQSALDEAGIDYELVKEGSALKSSSRRRTIERTGQKKFPWIEFEDGAVYRDDSKAMAETIKSGQLESRRAPAAPA